MIIIYQHLQSRDCQPLQSKFSFFRYLRATLCLVVVIHELLCSSIVRTHRYSLHELAVVYTTGNLSSLASLTPENIVDLKIIQEISESSKLSKI